jgi:hypothetical protein
MSEQGIDKPVEQQTTSGEFIKQENKFKDAMTKLGSLMKGKIAPSKRLKNNVVEDVVTEMLKERQEKLQIDFKAELSSIIDKKIELDKQFKLKEEELVKLKTEKYKEFNNAFQKLIDKVEDINALKDSYLATLKQAESSLNDIKVEPKA